MAQDAVLRTAGHPDSSGNVDRADGSTGPYISHQSKRARGCRPGKETATPGGDAAVEASGSSRATPKEAPEGDEEWAEALEVERAADEREVETKALEKAASKRKAEPKESRRSKASRQEELSRKTLSEESTADEASAVAVSENDEVVIIDAKTAEQVKRDERAQRSRRRTGGRATTEDKDLEAAMKLSIADEDKEWDGLEALTAASRSESTGHNQEAALNRPASPTEVRCRQRQEESRRVRNNCPSYEQCEEYQEQRESRWQAARDKEIEERQCECMCGGKACTNKVDPEGMGRKCEACSLVDHALIAVSKINHPNESESTQAKRFNISMGAYKRCV